MVLAGHSGLKAVIFDVDGTLVDSERDGHRVAFNRAFEEAGLPDRWGVERYGELLEITGGQRRLSAYLADQGMPEGRRAALARSLHERKTEIFAEMARGGGIPPRPGVTALLAELDRAGVRVAVATTGSDAWVYPLLDRLFGRDRFEVVVTRRDTSRLKPDPEAYRIALERLGLEPPAVLAIEDSRNGLQAAKATGLRCVVVVNGFTERQDLHEADLVLGDFGTPGEPAAVLADPHRVDPPGRLDADTLRRLSEVGPRRARRGEELAAAARRLSFALGGVETSEARASALERLAEMHASGAVSEEDFLREKRRLSRGV